jgi:hypothetical protein
MLVLFQPVKDASWERGTEMPFLFNSQLLVSGLDSIDQALSPWYESNIFEIFQPMGGII